MDPPLRYGRENAGVASGNVSSVFNVFERTREVRRGVVLSPDFATIGSFLVSPESLLREIFVRKSAL